MAQKQIVMPLHIGSHKDVFLPMCMVTVAAYKTINEIATYYSHFPVLKFMVEISSTKPKFQEKQNTG